MYKTIVLDCQNNAEMLSCNDCIVYHDCAACKAKTESKGSSDKKEQEQKPLQIIVI